MDWQLKRLDGFTPRPGPLLVVVMDGVGLGRGDEADAVALARTPVLDWLRANCPNVRLKAHGTAVGLPSDEDMGNSEVGHNALGAGRVFDQGAKLVNRAIADGSLFAGAVWKKLVAQCVTHESALHLIGLLSDGNVHSHQDHLHALISRAAAEGVKTLFVHPLLDGRDVPESSALTYIDRLEAHLAQFDGREGRRYRIASGGGRMVTTMDRYQADWRIVERGWNAHVHGEGRAFASAREAIETYRAEQPDLIDQFMPPFVIVAKDASPIGPIRDRDSVIFFNFRGDRALEISQAFERDAFPHFDRGRRPAVEYAGMMQYDGDEHVPAQYLVSPPLIERTLGEYLARNRVRQFACSETQKFGHVTYFWNGNRTGMFDAQFEEYLEIPSDRVPFQERPWMKSAEITDATIERLRAPRTVGRDTTAKPPAGVPGIRGFDFGRINYANGDMVGHTGDRRAAILAVEAVDLALGRLFEVVREVGGVALVTADHGNSDEMYEREKSGAIAFDPQTGRPRPRTSHSLNAVPLILYDPIGLAAGSHALTLTPAGIGRNLAPRPPAIGTDANAAAASAPQASLPVALLGLELPEGGAGLAHVAATCLTLLGYAAPADYAPSLLGKGM
jgi:2,3-bisphosphoglycerate-independent phosphoglycerate mutase